MPPSGSSARVAGRVCGALLVAACMASVAAAGDLSVVASASVHDRASVRVAVRNAGAAGVTAVAPEVLYQGHQARGAPLGELAPGAQHDWTFDFPVPTEPGSVPAVIHVRYADQHGRRDVPAVAIVSTPGLLPVPEVRATLTATAASGFTRTTLLLENPAPAPIHGRVVMVLPDDLETEPESQAAEVPGDGERRIPLEVQYRGAVPGSSAPGFALFEYGLEGRRHLAVASAAIPVATGGPAVPPLAVGAGALATAGALLVFAWRRAAARHRDPLS
jgi:hypothetical protein